jgi:hypothetical protein
MKTGMFTLAIDGRSTVDDGQDIARAITRVSKAFVGNDTA